MSYVPPPVPERWGKALWGQGHWNGQLGAQPAPASVVVSGNAASLWNGISHRMTAAPAAPVVVASVSAAFIVQHFSVLPALTGAVNVLGIDASFRLARAYQFVADAAEFDVDSVDAILLPTRHTTMMALRGDIIIDMNKPVWGRIGNLIPDPGIIHFGHRVTLTPRRW